MTKTTLLPVSSARTLIVSFALAILLGTGLLMLPLSTAGDGETNLVDALFTATSATCVTGLIVHDTGTHFSFFGQLVILVLIQAGGLGIMTFGTFLWLQFRRRASLTSYDVVLETLSAHYEPDIREVLRRVLRLVAVMEILGAAILSGRFLFDMPWYKAIWCGVFHSISAFCNAGFSLFATSLEDYVSDPVVNAVVIFLLVTGGLGFPVLVDIQKWFEARRSREKYRFQFHTRLVAMSTVILLVLGAVGIYLLERGNTLRDLPTHGKILASIFQSATPRTAGFNTLSMSKLAQPTFFMIMIFMFVGGSPCSTAGGVKTTTVTVLIVHAVSRWRDREQVTLGNRAVSNEAVDRAQVIILLSLSTLAILFFVLLVGQASAPAAAADPELLQNMLFEAFSAFGTVGLSTGITPRLTDPARVAITLLMFIGRLGALAFVAGLALPRERLKLRYPEEPVIVG